MSISLLLSHWRTDPEIASNIDASRSIPFRPARFAPLPESIHPALTKALKRQGITALYIHQSAAWEHAQARDNLVVVTGTASGKTLCYNLPVLDRLLRDPQARALYLFPTKARAQDQFDGLRDLVSTIESSASGFQPLVSVYDGDTPSGARPGIRAASRIILSNPDMLHTGI
jgi:DEAD/DEAH box helicase domain-containing protein